MAPEIMSQSDNWFSFHLLSEGDASTLGRYNSHFSHDILAHIIGEPIPGNCYMWSAPKQPFVLPVRIRDFEMLYKDKVVIDSNTEPLEVPVASRIKKKSEERDKQLADALLEKMKDAKMNRSLSSKDFPDNRLTGIYFGQLFIFLQNVKKLDDFKDEIRDANELLNPILSKLFGSEITIKKGEHPSKGSVDYYCVPTEKWQQVLGN